MITKQETSVPEKIKQSCPSEIPVPYRLASRYFQEQDTLVPIGKTWVGGKHLATIAGPCAVESQEQILQIAEHLSQLGIGALRGGAFKPRTSPYSFQGKGEQALKWLAEAREKTGLAVVTEVMDSESLALVSDYADVLQIGSRNMQNFSLLKKAARTRQSILLKRGMSNTIEELLLAAEYILSEGNNKVILCERGIRSFETHTRNTFDINAIAVLKWHSHLPVIADPSHGTGDWRYVAPVARAAVAAGADGVLIEVHPQPEKALSDGQQSLTLKKFQTLYQQLKNVAQAVKRTI